MYGITCCVWHHNVSNSLDGVPVVFSGTYFPIKELIFQGMLFIRFSKRLTCQTSSKLLFFLAHMNDLLYHNYDISMTHTYSCMTHSVQTIPLPGFLISFLERTFFLGGLYYYAATSLINVVGHQMNEFCPSTFLNLCFVYRFCFVNTHCSWLKPSMHEIVKRKRNLLRTVWQFLQPWISF